MPVASFNLKWLTNNKCAMVILPFIEKLGHLLLNLKCKLVQSQCDYHGTQRMAMLILSLAF